jgi:hypothetical protein
MFEHFFDANSPFAGLVNCHWPMPLHGLAATGPFRWKCFFLRRMPLLRGHKLIGYTKHQTPNTKQRRHILPRFAIHAAPRATGLDLDFGLGAQRAQGCIKNKQPSPARHMHDARDTSQGQGAPHLLSLSRITHPSIKAVTTHKPLRLGTVESNAQP